VTHTNVRGQESERLNTSLRQCLTGKLLAISREKRRVVPLHGMMAYGGIRGMMPLVCNLDTRRK